MYAAEVKPDVVMYNEAISTCDTAKHSDKAWELLQEMRQERLETDVFSYSAAQCM